MTTHVTPHGLTDPSLLRTASYVDGQWLAWAGGERLVVHNPSTGDVLADLPAVGAAETRVAIEAAQRALPA